MTEHFANLQKNNNPYIQGSKMNSKQENTNKYITVKMLKVKKLRKLSNQQEKIYFDMFRQ